MIIEDSAWAIIEAQRQARQKGLSLTYNVEDFHRLRRYEEFHFSSLPQEKYEEHLRDYTLLERLVMSKPAFSRTGEEEIIDEEIWRKQREWFENDPFVQGKHRERINAIIKRALNYELRRVLSGEAEEYPEYRHVHGIKITRQAYEKAEQISRTAVDAASIDNEIYLHGLASPSSDLISDFYIPHQSTTPVTCKVDTSKEDEDLAKISEAGKRVIAWAHSHANMRTFHSQQDIDNLEKITYLYGEEKEISLRILDPSRPTKVKVYRLPSIVFNAKGSSPSTAVSFEYRLFGDESPRIYLNENPHFEIIETEDEIDSSVESIERDIRQRVAPMGGFKRDFLTRTERFLHLAPEESGVERQKEETRPRELTLESLEERIRILETDSIEMRKMYEEIRKNLAFQRFCRMAHKVKGLIKNGRR